MSARGYLSIGEVLGLLKAEFPDVTISKIRFLESQGLIGPERTPSGYRKFYDRDVACLRWILTMQQEHFLPLKVIRERLVDGTAEIDDYLGATPPTVRSGSALVGSPPGPAVPSEVFATPERPDAAQPPPTAAATLAAAPPQERARRAVPPAELPKSTPTTRRPLAPFPESLRRPTTSEPIARLAAFLAPQSPPTPPSVPPGEIVALDEPEHPARDAQQADALGRDRPRRTVRLPDPEPIERSASELGRECGLTLAEVGELERFGLLHGSNGPGGRYYGEADLEIARLAARLAHFGVEARHLRLWKSAADREADLFEQIVGPLRRQRDGQTRRQAEQTLEELARLGDDLHAALVIATISRNSARKR